jgi:hypothetical protein
MRYGAHIRIWVSGSQRWRCVRREGDGYILVVHKSLATYWEDLGEAMEVAAELPVTMKYRYDDRGNPFTTEAKTGKIQVVYTVEFER